MKNNAFKIQIVLLFLIGSLFCYSQSQTVVGSITGGTPSLSVNIDTLKNAFNTEYNDGTVCNNVSIQQSSNNGKYYLVGFCQKSSLYMTVRVELQVVNSNLLVINAGEKTDCQSDCGSCYIDTCTCVNSTQIPIPCSFKTSSLINGTNHLGSFY